MPRFWCCLVDDKDDEDAAIEIYALHAEAAARGFIEYCDSRDSEYFPKPDRAHEVLVKGGGKSETYSLWYEYVKSWHVKSSANA